LYQEEWLLYPIHKYLSNYSIEPIFYEEFIRKFLFKKSEEIHKIAFNLSLDLMEKEIKLFHTSNINANA
jgi:hypothetical protein